MTIQRQYSLPNCVLTLEGLSDASLPNTSEIRPLLSILISAECRFTGNDLPMTGGRDFFEALVQAVSRYAQEFFSGVPHPDARSRQSALVKFERLEKSNLHRLSVRAESATDASRTENSPAMDVDLTSVQLFDLVEAVDQFFADSRTLPDLSLQLRSAPRRFSTSGEPIAKRAAPAAVGVVGLALAGAAFFFMPVPEVEKPKNIPLPDSETTSSPSPTAAGSDDVVPEEEPKPEEATSEEASPSPRAEGDPPSASELEAALTASPEITEPDRLYALNQYIYNDLDRTWDNRELSENDLTYRVGVAMDGAIVGYKGDDAESRDRANDTPLPDLLYFQPGGTSSQEPIAQFKVVFTSNGVLQISPWRGYSGQPGDAPKLADSAKVQSLQDKLATSLREQWDGKTSSPESLIYRVETNQAGEIADYESMNQPARDYRSEIPLPGLIAPVAQVTKSEVDGSEQVVRAPLARFRVVFTTGGKVEVSPWDGN